MRHISGAGEKYNDWLDLWVLHILQGQDEKIYLRIAQTHVMVGNYHRLECLVYPSNIRQSIFAKYIHRLYLYFDSFSIEIIA